MNNLPLTLFSPDPTLSIPIDQFLKEELSNTEDHLDLTLSLFLDSPSVFLDNSLNQDVLTTQTENLSKKHLKIALKILKKQLDALDQVSVHFKQDQDLSFRNLTDVIKLKYTALKNAWKIDPNFSLDSSQRALTATNTFNTNISDWSKKKLQHLKDQAKQDKDSILLKVIEVAANIENELIDYNLFHNTGIKDKTFIVNSCGLTAWAISRKIAEVKSPRFLPKWEGFGETTSCLRSQLGQGKENIFIIQLRLSSLISHTLAIHEKREGELYKYRLYSSYAGVYELKEFLVTSPIHTESKGWISKDELNKLLDKIDHFLDKDKTWNLKDVEDYYNCFGEKLWEMLGKRTLSTDDDSLLKQLIDRNDRIHPFEFYSLRKQKDDKFVLKGESNRHLQAVIVLLLAMMIAQLTYKLLKLA